MKDPLGEHRLFVKTGISQNPDSGYDIHLNSAYEYRDIFKIGLQHLPTSFYDLANQREVRRVNNGIFTEYKKFWQFDRAPFISQFAV
jgi:hypothetical protein